MVTANEQALPSVNDLDLPFFDYNEPGLVGEVYHRRLAEVRRQGWLARSPLSLVVGRSRTCSVSPGAGCGSRSTRTSSTRPGSGTAGSGPWSARRSLPARRPGGGR